MILEGRRALQTLFRWYDSRSLSSQLHMFGFATYLCGLTLSAFPEKPLQHEWIVTTAAIAFAAGTTLAAWRYVAAFWRHPLGKVLITLVHLFVLILSTMIARDMVASSLGLPPQDFDVTVSVFALLFYVPAWVFVMALLTGTAGLVLLALAMARTIIHRRVDRWAFPLANAAGSLMLAVLLIMVLQSVSRVSELSYPAARWIAYFGDFHFIPAYPCAPPASRVHVHENGVVSYARWEGSSLQIRIIQIEPTADCSRK